MVSIVVVVGKNFRVGKLQKNRADWTPERTALFCKLYCMQIDNGNMGVMSKSGWIDIRTRFFAATGMMHTTEQFSSRLRNLKKEWAFINLLRYEGSGLGRDANGNPVADDQWWENHTKVFT